MKQKQAGCPVNGYTSIGGQALLEGIMMKGPGRTVMATRLPDGAIDLEDLNETHIRDRYKIFGWPLIRGTVNMVESFIIGYKALMKSAEKLGLDEEKPAAPAAEAPADGETPEQPAAQKSTSGIMTIIGVVSTVLGIGLALVLFMWLPTVLFNLLNSAVTPAAAVTIRGLGEGVVGRLDGWKGVIEGVIKILIFLGYVAATALMKDIRRTYQYHGSEHKCIFCYEAGLPLTVENVRAQRRFHPRCGTSFLVLMLIVSILVSSCILYIFPGLRAITWLWIVVKILILPLILGLGYELIRFAGRHNNVFTRIMSAPGLWVQRLTTREPDDSMIEVAIAAMNAVIPERPEDAQWGK